MNVLDEKKVSKYLSAVKEISCAHEIYDVHVHPYEVVFDEFVYPFGSATRDVISLRDGAYRIPKIGEMVLDRPPGKGKPMDTASLKKVAMMGLRYTYGHIGSKVFSDSMELGGIDKALLLPVAPFHGGLEEKMLMLRSLYPDRKKFWIAGSVPNTICNDDIGKYVIRMCKEFDIRALKIHPIITGIDLNSKNGKDRLSCILDACGKNHLPLIVHCGSRSNLFEYGRGGYALIENMREIAWEISKSPVVIAHAGLYQCDDPDRKDDVLKDMNKLIARHDHLYVDTSGLGFDSLTRVLTGLERERILFGSDALYEPQWAKVVTLMHALSRLREGVEESYIEIASRNPCKVVFKEYVHN